MSRCLITGGAGFIGSHMTQRLVEAGEEVAVYDNLLTGKISNIKDVLGSVSFIEKDIRDIDALIDAAKGCDYIIHLAAIPSVPLSISKPALTNEVNITGTLNVLMAAREGGVRRVMYASSSAVYGDQFPRMAKKEEMPVNPLSPYATQKAAGEYYLKNFYENYGLETISFRCFNIFGPRQDPNSQYSGVISKFVTRMLRGLPPCVDGDGKQTRDFTYVSNVVDAFVLASKRASKDAAGKTFNIGCGTPVSLLTLIDNITKVTRTKVKPEFAPPRQGDIRYSYADITLAKRYLGYMPRVDLYQGMEKTIAYYREHITRAG
ncbi:MAG: SDR family oxidoreductase [Thermodesulfobacteriota bacterium]|nr:SDR family oxidoreductase [Thermodesulfobacteriota bacterium]